MRQRRGSVQAPRAGISERVRLRIARELRLVRRAAACQQAPACACCQQASACAVADPSGSVRGIASE